ncbi:TPA: hypothetical protein N0F65_011718 [Lagenidium giganteum]|uniref:Uncharacterized protein n=1 Tax=Lagenidium giganteum TaxID=4803 RepID=A0AAV2YIL3_9STRA|nr:TPA: hypothetical protein N0F65_011718 [Lagenidium giganteum]
MRRTGAGIIVSVLSIVLLVSWGTAVSAATIGATSGYGYSVQLDSRSDRIIYLAGYSFRNGGVFDIAVDVTLTIDKPGADKGRTMLYLLACNSSSVDVISQLSFANANGSVVSSDVPAVCAMANRTLDDLCASFPLEDQNPSDYVYRTDTVVSGVLGSSQDEGDVYFYIDACETVGGAEGVLRSCLNGGVTKDQCFDCPKNHPLSPTRKNNVTNQACTVPPTITPVLHVDVQMNLCDGNGQCLQRSTNFLPLFYLGYTIGWAVCCICWVGHIRLARESVVDLQRKMTLVPIANLLYAAMTTITLFTVSKLSGTAENVVINLTLLTAVLSLGVSAEVVVLIAKGWKITRPTLSAREHQWIRFVSFLWAAAFTVLKNSMIRHITVFLIWGVAWSSVVFMIWYNSAFNMNMLKYQVAMVRQLHIDPTRTPVYTKYMLFRRFRGLLGTYMFLSCVFGALGLLNDVPLSDTWRWSSVVADESLNLLLYVALGYTFRCRRFSHLFSASMAAGPVTPVNAAATAPLNATSPAEPTAETDSGETPPPRRKSAVIVVLNPDHDQALGTSYVPDHAKKDQAGTSSDTSGKNKTSPGSS